MAGFCDVDDVRELNPQRIYDGSSKPTLTQVEQLIIKIASEIRAILRMHAIDEASLSAEALIFLESLNATGAAYKAEQAGLMGRSPRLSEHARDLRDDYNSWIEDLKENPQMLETTSAASTVHSRPTDITPKDAGTDPADEAWEPRFKMEDPD